MEPVAPYPVYGSTFTAYRVSPLHHGASSIHASLPLHARRLRDILRGETVRGVRLAIDDPVAPLSSSTGSLRQCTWELFGDQAAWERAHSADAEDDDGDDDLSHPKETPMLDQAVGIRIALHYDRTVHIALLLKDPTPSVSTPQFTSFPLLLLRMPTPLRDLVVDYLRRAFDTHISRLRLRPAFLSASLERSLAGSQFDPAIATGGVRMQLAFPSADPALRTIDISLGQEDLARFSERRALTSLDPTSAGGSVAGPFTAALDRYLNEHLAFSLQHPDVNVAKVACSQFAFAAEGKVKISPPTDNADPSVAESLLAAVIAEARSELAVAVIEDRPDG